ncbi:MAG TPA: FecR domain-containing protein [Polyangiaceae bacterium]|nr:FecR domain-containing protein [Polyangiaceae bacterium]
MSDDASEVRRLLAPLRDRPVSVDPERLAARRARVVPTLQREVRGLVLARISGKRRRVGYLALALAAAAGALFLVQRSGRSVGSPPAITFVGSVGPATARASDNLRTLRAGENLLGDPGEIASAADGSAELTTSSGVALDLGAATRVSLAGLVGAAAHNQVELRQGQLTCSVPHLQEGERFSVQTPDARVVVHGTVFSVRVDSSRARGSETCVEVTDGVVIVQHAAGELALNRGDRWGCDASAASRSAPLAASSTPEPAVPRESEWEGRHPSPRSSSRPQPRGTLGEERALLQEALAAERTGQPERAQSLLNQLLTRYPGSALAGEARRASLRIAKTVSGK